MGTVAHPIIQFRNVSFAYPNGSASAPVLRELNLHLDPGEFVCVLGPSGCGKSTLLNLAAGFLRPDLGQVLFDGRTVQGPGPDRGVVFQEPTLFPWLNTRGNVEFGLRGRGWSAAEIHERSNAAMRRVGLTGAEELHPHALSGGMRQRAALARVMVLEPRALLMDEPFGALDVRRREQLQDELLQIWRERRPTVLFVTHNVEEAAYLADRVILLGPANIGLCAEKTIPLPRPRQRLGSDMGAIVTGLRRQLDELIPLSPLLET